jgi:hypothetical protein
LETEISLAEVNASDNICGDIGTMVVKSGLSRAKQDVWAPYSKGMKNEHNSRFYWMSLTITH